MPSLNGHSTILAPTYGPPPTGRGLQDQNAPPPVQDQNAVPGNSTGLQQPTRVLSVTMSGADEDGDTSRRAASTHGAGEAASSEECEDDEDDDDDAESDIDCTPLHGRSRAPLYAPLRSGRLIHRCCLLHVYRSRGAPRSILDAAPRPRPTHRRDFHSRELHQNCRRRRRG